MDKRKIHTIIRKYNEFNSRFGDDQFNIEIFKHKDGSENYVVSCDSELDTCEQNILFKYILNEIDYYENNLSQCEGGLSEQLEDLMERKIFKQNIFYLKNACKEI